MQIYHFGDRLQLCRLESSFESVLESTFEFIFESTGAQKISPATRVSMTSRSASQNTKDIIYRPPIDAFTSRSRG